MAADNVFVVHFKVLVAAVSSAADVARLKEMSDALEATAKDYGGEYVVKDVSWNA